ncbi:hypothetical protein C8J56DRAFT_196075 [Mycena floridula]|nr:hypothetical protein C8J56DRAFT_196075 [Mycena floridula]
MVKLFALVCLALPLASLAASIPAVQRRDSEIVRRTKNSEATAPQVDKLAKKLQKMTLGDGQVEVDGQVDNLAKKLDKMTLDDREASGRHREAPGRIVKPPAKDEKKFISDKQTKYEVVGGKPAKKHHPIPASGTKKGKSGKSG